MERYHFFRSSCHQFGFNCKSLSELKSDESEDEGALATVLKVLKQVHNMFFDVCPVFLLSVDIAVYYLFSLNLLLESFFVGTWG